MPIILTIQVSIIDSRRVNITNDFLVWPIVNAESGGYNKTGIALALIAIYNFSSRSFDPAKGEPSHLTSDKPSSSAAPAPSRTNWLADGIALGSFLFTLHCFLSDPSTLVAWSWSGYPVKGPLPHLHGSLTHLAQAIGLLIAAYTSGTSSVINTSHPLWFAYGAASAAVMYLYRDWPGYIGGWNFALFLMSIIPTVLGSAALNKHIGKTFFMAFLTTALLDVANTFTVAYAFVPGGEYFRERTNWWVMCNGPRALLIHSLQGAFRPDGRHRSSISLALFQLFDATAYSGKDAEELCEEYLGSSLYSFASGYHVPLAKASEAVPTWLQNPPCRNLDCAFRNRQ